MNDGRLSLAMFPKRARDEAAPLSIHSRLKLDQSDSKISVQEGIESPLLLKSLT
jgi:hypothetical protein